MKYSTSPTPTYNVAAKIAKYINSVLMRFHESNVIAGIPMNGSSYASGILVCWVSNDKLQSARDFPKKYIESVRWFGSDRFRGPDSHPIDDEDPDDGRAPLR